ncbi:MAG: RNA polymerase factor sigma-54, partial [Marinomonas sp.]
MKQSLQLKIGQQLTMTPQLQQAIRLLQLSTLDLKQEIHEFLESNPLLEIDDEDFSHSEAPTREQEEAASKKTEANASEEARVESEWTDSIPAELSIDSNWDDTYQNSAAASVGSSNNYEGDSDYESRNAPAESIQDHLIWQLNLT